MTLQSITIKDFFSDRPAQANLVSPQPVQGVSQIGLLGRPSSPQQAPALGVGRVKLFTQARGDVALEVNQLRGAVYRHTMNYPKLKAVFEDFSERRKIMKSANHVEMKGNLDGVLKSMANHMSEMEIDDLIPLCRYLDELGRAGNSQAQTLIGYIFSQKRELVAHQIHGLIGLLCTSLDPIRHSEHLETFQRIIGDMLVMQSGSLVDIQMNAKNILGEWASLMAIAFNDLNSFDQVMQRREDLLPLYTEVKSLHKIFHRAFKAKVMEEPRKTEELAQCVTELAMKGSFKEALDVTDWIENRAIKASSQCIISQTLAALGNFELSLMIANEIEADQTSEKSHALFSLAQNLFDQGYIADSHEVAKGITDHHLKSIILNRLVYTFLERQAYAEMADCANRLLEPQRIIVLKDICLKLCLQKKFKEYDEFLGAVSDPNEKAIVEKELAKIRGESKTVRFLKQVSLSDSGAPQPLNTPSPKPVSPQPTGDVDLQLVGLKIRESFEELSLSSSGAPESLGTPSPKPISPQPETSSHPRP